MDGIFLTLAATMGSIDENGEILASGEVALLDVEIEGLGYEQFRNTDAAENEFGSSVFGLGSSIVSNDGTESSSRKDSQFKIESV
jgi:hypothetical protein